MSSEDKVRPFHAEGKAAGQEAADAVAAVLAHAAERDDVQHLKAEPRKQKKWMLPLGINLGVFAVWILAAPPAWVVVNPLEAPPIVEQVDDMKLAMFMQAMRVDAYALQNGSLPNALEDAGSPVSGVEYAVLDDGRYHLRVSIGGEVLLYDSSESAQEWVGADAGNKLLAGSQ